MTLTELRAVVLARVSTIGQADNTSLDEQEQVCLREIERRGWRHTKTYREVRSGAAKHRDVLEAVMDAARSGEIDALIVKTQDRLARDEVVRLLALRELKELNVVLVSLDVPGDYATPEAQLTGSVVGAVAEWERQRIRSRLVAGQNAVAAAGYWPGGQPPYGYRSAPAGDMRRKRLEIHANEAEIVRRTVALILDEGRSVQQVADLLNAEGSRIAWASGGVMAPFARCCCVMFSLRTKSCSATPRPSGEVGPRAVSTATRCKSPCRRSYRLNALMQFVWPFLQP